MLLWRAERGGRWPVWHIASVLDYVVRPPFSATIVLAYASCTSIRVCPVLWLTLACWSRYAADYKEREKMHHRF